MLSWQRRKRALKLVEQCRHNILRVLKLWLWFEIGRVYCYLSLTHSRFKAHQSSHAGMRADWPTQSPGRGPIDRKALDGPQQWSYLLRSGGVKLWRGVIDYRPIYLMAQYECMYCCLNGMWTREKLAERCSSGHTALFNANMLRLHQHSRVRILKWTLGFLHVRLLELIDVYTIPRSRLALH